MKKSVNLFLMLLLSVSLVACGAAPSNESGSPEDLDEKSNRLPTSVMQIMLEGMEENVPATLYQGKGYSVYIPDEGWTQQGYLEEDGSDSWVAESNTLVSFQIARFSNETAEGAEKRLMQDFDNSYDLQPTEDNRYIGTLGEQNAVFQLIGEIGDDYYYLIEQYPAEAIEGFGAWTAAIADTFEIE